MVAFGILGVAVGALVTMEVLTLVAREDQSLEIVSLDHFQPELVLQASTPVHLRIPTVGIAAHFEKPLGLQNNQEIQVPEAYETVAYYKHGPTPGELGPSVILGHVDSYKGPAVFYSLGQLQEGDTIEIDRDDGTTAIFAVDRLERHMQSGFPTKQVYGDLDYAGLRLITCSGTFDRGIQRYSHNLIVFARLVDTSAQESAESLDI